MQCSILDGILEQKKNLIIGKTGKILIKSINTVNNNVPKWIA